MPTNEVTNDQEQPWVANRKCSIEFLFSLCACVCACVWAGVEGRASTDDGGSNGHGTAPLQQDGAGSGLGE